MKKYPKYKDSAIDWLGDIPGHREIVKLKKMVVIKNKLK